MQTVKYMGSNPGNNPYGDWKPEGFLAGWQYADKMKDYRTTKDLSDESSFLANEMSRMQNRDFSDLSNLNEVQRQVLRQRAGHELNRLPTEEGIKGMQAGEQYSTMADPRGREARVEKGVLDSIYSLDTTRRKAAMDNTAAASTILQSMPIDADPNLVIQQLSKSGVDVSGLYDPDPESMRYKLHLLRSIDPSLLKSEYERRKQTDVDTAAMARLKEQLASQERVAGMKSQEQTAAEAKEAALKQQGEIYVRERSKVVGREQAELELAQMRLRDPYFQQGAAGQREITTPQATLESFKGNQTNIPNTAPVPKQKTMILPEVGEVEVLEQLPGGAIKFKKGNRTGTWRP